MHVERLITMMENEVGPLTKKNREYMDALASGVQTLVQQSGHILGADSAVTRAPSQSPHTTAVEQPEDVRPQPQIVQPVPLPQSNLPAGASHIEDWSMHASQFPDNGNETSMAQNLQYQTSASSRSRPNINVSQAFPPRNNTLN